MSLTTVTLAERPDVVASVRRLTAAVWDGAEFMYHDAACSRHWNALFTTFREFQVGALAPVTIDRERDLGRYEEPNVWLRHVVTKAGDRGEA